MPLKLITEKEETELAVKNAKDYLEGDLYGLVELPLYGDNGLRIYSELVKLSKARGYKGEHGIVLAALEVLLDYRFNEYIKTGNRAFVDEKEPDFIVAR